MKPLFSNPNEIEKSVKEKYAVPLCVMMENAAETLAKVITDVFDNDGRGEKFFSEKGFEDIIFVCGKGNNGADGIAAARKLFWKLPVKILLLEKPVIKTSTSKDESHFQNEAFVQFSMAKKLKIPFISKTEFKTLAASKNKFIIVDCIYGTGFHGELSKTDSEIIEIMNKTNGFKIACDIPSALKFKADITVTMGTLKTCLYSDESKNVCGEIVLSELGISENIFSKDAKPDAYLLEECDITLPFRTEKTTHKGKFGHAIIVAGEKSGAAVMASEAALSFGAGLVSIFKTPSSNLSQFKISPELMITENYPKNTTAVLIGSGLGVNCNRTVLDFFEWFNASKNPSCVLDADFFSLDFEKIFGGKYSLSKILSGMNSVPGTKIVLTPHAKELCVIYEKCLRNNTLNQDKNQFKNQFTEEYSPTEILNHRIEIGKAFTKKYPNITLVMKGANTFIASNGEIFVFDGGAQNLSKGGSGDVLAGMITSLLAQGYSSKDATITGVFRHGTAGSEFGKTAYNLTPKKLIELI